MHNTLKYKLFLSSVLAAMFVLLQHHDAVAQVKKPDYFIDDEQKRIDLLDGTLDGDVALEDVNDNRATAIFISRVDTIQELINNLKTDEGKRKHFRDNLYMQLRRVNANNYHQIKRFEHIFLFIESGLRAIPGNRIFEHLNSNLQTGLSLFAFFKHETGADSFLIFAGRYKPETVFKIYDVYYNKDYALHVLEQTAKNAPVTVKRYFTKGNGIFETLKMSGDSAVIILLNIRENYGQKSNAYALLDDIVNHKLTIEEADKTGTHPQKYLRNMMQIRAREKPLAAYSLEAELEIYALKFVRVVNDLHNEKDEVRFASVENFTAEELYTLMVYSQEEIFTSTFNGLFKRMMFKMGAVSGFDFLKNLGDNRFRTFIKMSAGFGKLSQFLQSMTPVYQQMLMVKFVTGLEKYNDLSQAVEVADAFGSITDTLVLKILKASVKLEYLKLTAKKDVRGKTIYGLLSSLFVERNIGSENWFNSVAKQYALPNFDRIEYAKMLNHDTVSRWLLYFYDDEDGEASFSTFLKSFNDPNWSIADSGIYVLIQSKSGTPVHIYANKNKHEYDGQEKLENLFNEKGWEQNVMVHRGHSYYAAKTIEKIRENTQVFVLGSCGGYHSISTIIERSSEASIISSKQIGTMFVNNPMLKLMADDIRNGKDLEWQKIWDELGVQVKDNAKAYERFLDYIPPHKNLGAIFIKTYNRVMGNS